LAQNNQQQLRDLGILSVQIEGNGMVFKTEFNQSIFVGSTSKIKEAEKPTCTDNE